jgi:hypothetical protein
MIIPLQAVQTGRYDFLQLFQYGGTRRLMRHGVVLAKFCFGLLGWQKYAYFVLVTFVYFKKNMAVSRKLLLASGVYETVAAWRVRYIVTVC